MQKLVLNIFNKYFYKKWSRRSRVREPLRQSESQLNAAQMIANFGSWSWDMKSNQVHWSDHMFRIGGYSPQAFVPTVESAWKLVHPDDQVSLAKAFQEAMMGRRPYSFEYRIIRVDGVERFVQAVGEICYGLDGRPEELIGTLHDITEKKIEINLRESEQKFRGLLDTAYDSIIVIDEDENIEYANRQVKTWLGYDPEELVGQSIEIIIPKNLKSSSHQKSRDPLSSVFHRLVGQNVELWARRKDGSELPVEISFSPFKKSKGKSVTAFIRDLSDQKRAEAQQRFLADTSHILSETVNYEERIQRISNLIVPNRADWCAIYIQERNNLNLKAVAQNESLPSHLVRKLAENSCLLRENSKLNIGSVAKLGVPHLIEELSDEMLNQLTFNDSDCIQQIRSLNVQSLILVPLIARGRNIGVIVFARCRAKGYSQKDLALANLMAERAALAIDNAKLYKEAQDAIQLREDILAVVSHDLRNPLGVIHGFNEIIAKKIQQNDFRAEDDKCTEAIARAVKQMERLIGDLLDFAKIESCTFSIEPKPCCANKIIWEGIELVKNQTDKKNVSVQVELPSKLPLIVCDPDRIKQVLANLLSNAIKFSPENGQVKIRSELHTDCIEFVIKDKGPGISKESIPHIFERYWQAKETAKLGNGLGLAIAKGIIKSHCGQIRAESESGVGTTIYFTLPIDATVCKRESN